MDTRTDSEAAATPKLDTGGIGKAKAGFFQRIWRLGKRPWNTETKPKDEPESRAEGWTEVNFPSSIVDYGKLKNDLKLGGLTAEDAHFLIRETYGEGFQKIGARHGKAMVPSSAPHMTIVAMAEAEGILQTIRSWYRKQKDDADGKKTAQEDTKVRAQAHLGIAQSRKAQIDAEYADRPSSFSTKLAAFYIFLAFALLAADTLFSWDLTVRGFNLDAEQPWLRWALTGSVSLGIASIGVYIKYIYGLYMCGHPNRAATMRRTPLPGVEVYQFWWHGIRMNVAQLLRFAIHMVILFIMLFGLVTLGMYRHDTLGAMNEHAKRESRGRAGLEKTAAQPLVFLQPGVPPAEPKQYPANGTNPNTAQPGSADEETGLEHERRIYILLTLLFPVISGIILAVGLQMIHNNRARNDARNEVKTRGDEFDNANAAYQGTLKDLNRLSELYEVFQAVKPDEIGRSLIARYRMGYETGLWAALHLQQISDVEETIDVTPEPETT